MKNSIFQSILKLSILCSVILLLLSSVYATGVLDPTFGTNGKAEINLGRSVDANRLTIQPDGKIIALGNLSRTLTNNAVTSDIMMFRFNSNGSPDSSFGNGGKVTTALSSLYYFASAVALQSNGKIVITVGIRPSVISNGGFGDFLVARYNPNGTPDITFGTDGVVRLSQGTYNSANAVAIQSDGKIVVAGETSNAAGSIAVFRLNEEDGSVDTSFADNGFLIYRYNIPNYGTTYARSKNLVILPNGRILVGVMATRYDGFVYATYASVLMMLETDGTFAQNFGSSGIASFTYSMKGGVSNFDLAVFPDGKILTVSNENMLFSSIGKPEWFASYPDDYDTNVAIRTDGKYIIMGTGEMRLFSPDRHFIGSAIEWGPDIEVQPDNKIIVVKATNTGFKVTRFITFSSQGTFTANYDGDEKTDIAVLRPTNSTLYVLRSFEGFISYPSGEASFEIKRVMAGRYSYYFPFIYWKGGNIIGTPASFCGTGAGSRSCYQWGQIGDIPVTGEFGGFTVYRPSEGIWYITQDYSENPFRAVRWGSREDKPVPADYDYDGITDIAVYRPSTGTWWILRSSDGGHFSVKFGIASDIPLTGDFDGDGFADFTVYRASEGIWYQLLTTEGFRAVKFGLETDVPVPGDYDGDGRHDIAVFREGIWYLLQSTEGFKAVQWGSPGDVPVSVRYDR